MILPRTPEWLRYLNERLPGETPDPDDDFFNDGVVSADWTELTVSGSQTITEEYGLLVIEYQNQTSPSRNALLRSRAPAVGDYIETCVDGPIGSHAGGNAWAMLTMSDGVLSSSNCVVIGVYVAPSATQVLVWRSEGTFASSSTDLSQHLIADPQQLFPNRVYMRLTYTSANTFTPSFNFHGSGAYWNPLGSQSFSLTPTHVGIAWAVWTGTSNTKFNAHHYFRYNAA